jgi:PadR family transcriptional regulator AphA
MTTLGYALLGLLARDPLSGYDLARQLKHPIGFYWHARHSQIYPELATLEAAGLVSHQVVEQTDRPDKKVYAITDAGRTALSAWVTSPLATPFIREELVLRAASLWVADHDLARRMFDDHAQRHAQTLAEYEAHERWLHEHAAHELRDPWSPMFAIYATLRRGIGYEREYLAWCTWMARSLRDEEVGLPPAAKGTTAMVEARGDCLLPQPEPEHGADNRSP